MRFSVYDMNAAKGMDIMKELLDVVYDEKHADLCTLDMYLPDTGAPFPVMVYFHGGGIESGSKDIPPEFKSLTSKGAAVVSAEYRMYPDAVFPEFIEDAAKAIAFVKQYGEANNLFSGFYVGGSSAGAYLAMMNYYDQRYLGRYDIIPDSIDGWMFDSGQTTVHFNVLRERGLDTRAVRIDEAAPIYFIDRDVDFSNQSRLLFIVAEDDMPNRLEQNKLMIKTMEHFNYNMSKVTYKFMAGCTHCSYPIDEMTLAFIMDNA